MPAIIDATTLLDINCIDTAVEEDRQQLSLVHEQFWAGVDEMKLLLQDGAILFCPTSFGKDSSITLLMALEAQRQMLVAGHIQPDHPLISSTVNTNMEAIPMVMFQEYAKKRLLAYAQLHGINLKHEIVSPTLNDNYFIRFVGAQKLISNSSRNGDCSVILKIKPSEAFVKTIIEQYPGKNVICILGSRKMEGNRRTTNMSKQGIAKKTIDDIRSELSSVALGKVQLLNFAPIRDWATDQVFDLLRIAGSKPLRKTNLHIPAFLNDFGLLLEIYGNAGSESCSVSVGQTSGGSGCNGTSRFGCTMCPMVGTLDKSSTSLATLERWRVLGVENATRLRDYMWRLSNNMDARSYHAKAYDPACYSRIVLQPNTLKSKYLEKIIRYAAQLTVDSIRASEHYNHLASQGLSDEHPGIIDIRNDVNIPPKTKAAFIEMYKEALSDPKNLNYLFDIQHAILLSLRWSIDGVSSAPFRPLAIWLQTQSGKGWLPYPQLNSEIEEKTGKKLKITTGNLPEAVMFRVFQAEQPETFAANPIDALTLWSRPADISDVNDEDSNCTIDKTANHHTRSDVTYKTTVDVIPCSLEAADFVATIDGNSACYRMKVHTPTIKTITLNNRSVSTKVADLLLENGLYEAVNDNLNARLKIALENIALANLSGSKTEVEAHIDTLLEPLRNEFSLTRSVRHIRNQQLFTGYTAATRKIEPSLNFTKRVCSIQKGKIKKGNTRLRFYGLNPDSRLHLSHANFADLLVPDFSTHTQKHISTHDLKMQSNIDECLTENIQINLNAFERFKCMGGLTRAIEMHDNYFKSKIKNRHRNKDNSLRVYSGSYPAEFLVDHGIVSIAATYLPQYHFILRRTQFFDQLGAFSFQSKDHNYVLNHPKAITMLQHRSQKAQLLLHVRKSRNLQRSKVKEQLRQQQCGNYSEVVGLVVENLSTFETIAKQAITHMCTGLASSAFHLRFHTAEVSSMDMAKVNMLWSHLYLVQSTPADMLKAVLPPAQYRNLQSSPADYLVATRAAVDVAAKITTVIKNELTSWEGTLNNLKNILTKDHAGKSYLSAYRTIIESSPYAMSGHDNLTWNPSMEWFQKILSRNTQFMDLIFAHMNEVLTNLNSITADGQRTVVRKLTLSEKMAIMALRAA